MSNLIKLNTQPTDQYDWNLIEDPTKRAIAKAAVDEYLRLHAETEKKLAVLEEEQRQAQIELGKVLHITKDDVLHLTALTTNV